ncbi:hypothetical protein NDU88_009977 [Pleurodeles waltl]|uniref:Uncharacterized protein n=1 Tax=Pleurodeles waltl TaxID=8319 RepID=A0AAV7PWW3_PLEWA|nr:hypothetical protein NDU88_009977 [Pleurodeles waltl]
MPPKRTSAQKGTGRDPELSQLLRLVLQKLGSEDSREVTGPREEEGGSDRGKRPKRSHVAPSAAFPPVKRRRNVKAPVPASINLTPPTAVSMPVQITLPDTPAPPTGPPPAPPHLARASRLRRAQTLRGFWRISANPWQHWRPQLSPGHRPHRPQGWSLPRHQVLHQCACPNNRRRIRTRQGWHS